MEDYRNINKQTAYKSRIDVPQTQQSAEKKGD